MGRVELHLVRYMGTYTALMFVSFLLWQAAGCPAGALSVGGFCLGWGFCDECIEQPFGIGFRLPYSVLSCDISAVLCNQGYLQAHFWS